MKCELDFIKGVKFPLLETEKAYIAGIVDSEGSVTLVYANNHRTIRPIVYIYNTNLLLLEWIHLKFPKASLQKPKVARSENWKKVYLLSFTSLGNCQSILKVIYPYLQIKRQQAEIVLQFCQKHQRCSYYNDNDKAQLQSIQNLNKRGA